MFIDLVVLLTGQKSHPMCTSLKKLLSRSNFFFFFFVLRKQGETASDMAWLSAMKMSLVFMNSWLMETS